MFFTAAAYFSNVIVFISFPFNISVAFYWYVFYVLYRLDNGVSHVIHETPFLGWSHAASDISFMYGTVNLVSS